MIRANNPEIDVDALMVRVREEAAQLRTSGVVEARRSDPSAVENRIFARALERRRAIDAYLREAEERNRARTTLPRRFARVGGLFGFAGRFALRAFNYATKQQREVAAAQMKAIRLIVETTASAAEYAERLDDLDRSVLALEARIADVRAAALRAASFARSDIASLRRHQERAGAAASLEAAQNHAYPVSPAVIALIEERFRGSSSHVRNLAEPYIERIQSTGTVTAATPLLDLGCGRGDFLALLKERGLPARGVDGSEIAVAQARERGLDVEAGDALAALFAAPDASLGAVTAIHLIEHVPFGALTALVEQALRALRPGGILVLETPNPRNLYVATYTFRFDPTHRQPIPSELLALVLEATGFSEIQTLDLHPPVPPVIPAEGPLAELNATFFGAQDYAAIAVRPR